MRWRLVEATLDALMEHEYNNTSTTEIVRLAGVSRGALGHHFSCKAELIAAASEHMLTEATREIEELASKLISTLRGMGVQTILRLETEYYDQMLAAWKELLTQIIEVQSNSDRDSITTRGTDKGIMDVPKPLGLN